MIRSFADKRTAGVHQGHVPKGIPADIARRGQRKLTLLDGAANLEFLRSPPGNRLEALSGDRLGQHSIRINDQWRICFRWFDGGAHSVEIVDYH